jgi:hypothetical protein
MKSNLKLVESKAVELPIPKLTRSIAVVAEKKKRGRPRIMPIAIIEEPPPLPPVEILEKKKRGRPRLIKVQI